MLCGNSACLELFGFDFEEDLLFLLFSIFDINVNSLKYLNVFLNGLI
jgi:hypothetical protein